MTRFWFFGKGGEVFIATAECSSPDSARRLALDYNQEAGPLGPIDLITDAKELSATTLKLAVEPGPTLKRSR